MIKHNCYENGKVQSLSFTRADGLEATVGVIAEAGSYDFGVAERREMIDILNGILFDSQGKEYRRGAVLVFQKGDQIKFSTKEPVAYACTYF